MTYSKNSCALIPSTDEYVAGNIWKRDFIDVIKLRTLRWGDYPGLFKWSQYNLKTGGSESGKGDVRLEAEGGRRGHKPGNLGRL